jgi:hypothetical protein
MDDRILLVPAFWMPDPAVFEEWPALRALSQRLKDFLAVDSFLWPTLKGQAAKGSGIEGALAAFRAQIRPLHHIVTIAGFGEILLEALTRKRARSLVVAGFVPLPRTAALLGSKELATALSAAYDIMLNDAQRYRVFMSGAKEADIQRATKRARQNRDEAAVTALAAELRTRQPSAEIALKLPTLCLTTAARMPAKEQLFDLFRSYVPGAQRGELQVWGSNLFEDAAGHELADRAIAFIQGVMARRQKAKG